MLTGRGVSAEELDAVEAEARDLVAAATQAAKDAPFPPVSAAATDIWAQEGTSWRN